MNTNIKEVNEHINNLNNEVARLTCSLCEKQHDYSYEECLIEESGRSIVGEFKELNNEVARLRELLASSIAINKKWVPRDYTDHKKVEDIEQEAQLAPAPEEPVIQENRTTEPVSECNNPFQNPSKRPTCVTCDRIDKMVWHSDTFEWVCENTHDLRCLGPEPAPEWRELGSDEVIQEGDEVQPKHHDKINGEWQKAWSFELGVKAGHFKAMRYRTRRPLPKTKAE